MTSRHDPSAPDPGAGGPPSPPRGLAHAGVTVRDADRSLAFYVDGLGLRCISRRRVDEDYILRIVQVPGTTAIEVMMLALPDGTIVVELVSYDGDGGDPAARSPGDPGTGHLCLYVDDVHEARRRALDAGGRARSPEPVTIGSGPFAGGVGCYLADPDGYPIELLQAPTRAKGLD